MRVGFVSFFPHSAYTMAIAATKPITTTTDHRILRETRASCAQ
jgi:hypothetical protein